MKFWRFLHLCFFLLFICISYSLLCKQRFWLDKGSLKVVALREAQVRPLQMCCLVSRTAPRGISTRAANTNADQGREYDFKDDEEEMFSLPSAHCTTSQMKYLALLSWDNLLIYETPHPGFPHRKLRLWESFSRMATYMWVLETNQIPIFRQNSLRNHRNPFLKQ